LRAHQTLCLRGAPNRCRVLREHDMALILIGEQQLIRQQNGYRLSQIEMRCNLQLCPTQPLERPGELPRGRARSELAPARLTISTNPERVRELRLPPQLRIGQFDKRTSNMRA